MRSMEFYFERGSLDIEEQGLESETGSEVKLFTVKLFGSGIGAAVATEQQLIELSYKIQGAFGVQSW